MTNLPNPMPPGVVNYEEMEDGVRVPCYIYTRAERVAVLHKALDWLDANPDKHITGTLAEDAKGEDVSPIDPTAECFCILGRMVIEGKLAPALEPDENGQLCGDDYYRTLNIYMALLDTTATQLFNMNDCGVGVLTPEQLAKNRERIRKAFPA